MFPPASALTQRGAADHKGAIDCEQQVISCLLNAVGLGACCELMEQSPARFLLPRLTTVMSFLLACGRKAFSTAPAAAAAQGHMMDGRCVTQP